jgi:hypothetical protein
VRRTAFAASSSMIGVTGPATVEIAFRPGEGNGR